MGCCISKLVRTLELQYIIYWFNQLFCVFSIDDTIFKWCSYLILTRCIQFVMFGWYQASLRNDLDMYNQTLHPNTAYQYQLVTPFSYFMMQLCLFNGHRHKWHLVLYRDWNIIKYHPKYKAIFRLVWSMVGKQNFWIYVYIRNLT